MGPSASSSGGRSHLLASITTPQTPKRRKEMHSETADTNLESARQANLADIGSHVCEIPLQEFFDNYLPPLRTAFRSKKILSYLQQSGAITDQGWTDLPVKPKARKRVKEDICYADVQKVVDAIVAACQKADSRSKAWVINFKPYQAPRASLRETSCRPDCTISLCVRDNDHVWWDDVAINGEFKKNDVKVEDQNQVIAQILWDMNQTMRNDPSRRFTIGFTIENTDMRLWHCDRSDSLSSQVFDFIEDYLSVIRFFTSVMFAEKQQLGWDPTMTRIPNTDQFFITVRTEDKQETRFRTTKLLSFLSAEALRGRATRVWECHQVDDEGETLDSGPFALKDTWIDADRPREGDIITTLRGLGSTPDEKATLQEALLSVRCHGDVYIDGKIDLTIREDAERDLSDYDFFQVEQEKPSDEKRRKVAAINRKRMASPASGLGQAQIKDIPQYQQKAHYRIVYGEVGVPLNDITLLSTMFFALGGIIPGLQAMHKNGWVHRDISTSNILLVDNRPKIGDLEYARRYDEVGQHTICTDNVLFTPVEISANHYAFLPNDNNRETDRISVIKYEEYLREFTSDGSSPGVKSTPNGTSDKQGKRVLAPMPVVQYNPLHDVESDFWMAVHSSVNRKVVRIGGDPPAPRSPDSEEAQKTFARTMFTEARAADRENVLLNPTVLKNWLQHLDPSLDDVSESLFEICELLSAAYFQAERDITSADWFAVAEPVYGGIQRKFLQIACLLKNQDIEVDCFDSPPADSDAAVHPDSSMPSDENKRRKLSRQ